MNTAALYEIGHDAIDPDRSVVTLPELRDMIEDTIADDDSAERGWTTIAATIEADKDEITADLGDGRVTIARRVEITALIDPDDATDGTTLTDEARERITERLTARTVYTGVEFIAAAEQVEHVCAAAGGQMVNPGDRRPRLVNGWHYFAIPDRETLADYIDADDYATDPRA